ncbi:MAG: hypothetical protein RHS_4443 [Robinsoniella sp. RHS]|nr:MAG: hypothetical protein RHS_4443 [Robinsoniella sp. RHS]
MNEVYLHLFSPSFFVCFGVGGVSKKGGKLWSVRRRFTKDM